MAASSFLASLVVALTAHIGAAGTCSGATLDCGEGKSKDPDLDGTDAAACCRGKCDEDCTTVPDTKNNPALFTQTADGKTGDDITKCCQPSCKSLNTLAVTCDAGKGKDAAEVFCPGNAADAPCSKDVCCTVTLGVCGAPNCKVKQGETPALGQYVLKSPAPDYCAGAACTNDECCDAAQTCTQAQACADSPDNLVALAKGTVNPYCLSTACDIARECCSQTLTLDLTGGALANGATTLTASNVDKIEIGDTFTFVYPGDGTVHTVDGKSRRLAEAGGRRLAAGTITFSPAATAASIGTGTTITLSPAMSVSAVSDPITFYRGYKTKFWLPNDKLTLLLETKDIKLYASVLEGPSEDLQWFGSFYVFNSDGSKLCEIDVNRNEIRSPDSFEQIVIKLGDSDTPLPAQIQTYGSKNGKVKFSISTMPWNTPGDYNFTQVQELVYFETDDLVFMILPSHAGNEFPTSKTLALKYMHLDFIVREMKGEEQFGGILPEFWGLKVRSEEAYAMLTKPSRSRALSGDDCGNCNGAPFWE